MSKHSSKETSKTLKKLVGAKRIMTLNYAGTGDGRFDDYQWRLELIARETGPGKVDWFVVKSPTADSMGNEIDEADYLAQTNIVMRKQKTAAYRRFNEWYINLTLRFAN